MLTANNIQGTLDILALLETEYVAVGTKTLHAFERRVLKRAQCLFYTKAFLQLSGAYHICRVKRTQFECSPTRVQFFGFIKAGYVELETRAFSQRHRLISLIARGRALVFLVRAPLPVCANFLPSCALAVSLERLTRHGGMLACLSHAQRHPHIYIYTPHTHTDIYIYGDTHACIIYSIFWGCELASFSKREGEREKQELAAKKGFQRRLKRAPHASCKVRGVNTVAQISSPHDLSLQHA